LLGKSGIGDFGSSVRGSGVLGSNDSRVLKSRSDERLRESRDALEIDESDHIGWQMLLAS